MTRPAATLGFAAALFFQAPFAAQAEPLTTRPDPVLDPSGFLVGHWTWDEDAMEDELGPSEIDLAIDYRADGTFAMEGTVILQVEGEPWPIEVSSEGTWRAMVNEAGHILVTFNARNTTTTPGSGTTVEEVVRTQAYEVLGEDRVADASSGDIMDRI